MNLSAGGGDVGGVATVPTAGASAPAVGGGPAATSAASVIHCDLCAFVGQRQAYLSHLSAKHADASSAFMQSSTVRCVHCHRYFWGDRGLAGHRRHCRSAPDAAAEAALQASSPARFITPSPPESPASVASPSDAAAAAPAIDSNDGSTEVHVAVPAYAGLDAGIKPMCGDFLPFMASNLSPAVIGAFVAKAREVSERLHAARVSGDADVEARMLAYLAALPLAGLRSNVGGRRPDADILATLVNFTIDPDVHPLAGTALHTAAPLPDPVTDVPATSGAPAPTSNGVQTDATHDDADLVQLLRRRLRGSLRSGKRLSKLFARLLSPSGRVDPQTAFQRLGALHPTAYTDAPLPTPDSSAPVVQNLNVSALLKIIKYRIDKDAAPGIDGWTQELLLAVAQDPVSLRGLAALVHGICNGSITDPLVRAALLGSRLVAVPKPNSDGVRPIAVGSVLCKIASHYMLGSVIPFLRQFFAPHQLGLFVSGGVERALFNVQDAMHSLGRNGYLISVDLANAFNTRSRHKVLSTLYNTPELAPLFRLVHWTYGARTPLHFFNDRAYHGTLWSEEGVRQGDVLGSLLFALSIHGGLQAAAKASPALVVAIHDDVTIVGRKNAVRRAFCAFVKHVCGLLHRPPGTPTTDVMINKSKCVVFCAASEDDAHPSRIPARLRRLGLRCQVGGALRLLGAFVAWDDASRRASTLCDVHERLRAYVNLLASPAFSAQLFSALLRMCVIPAFFFLARVTPPEVFAPSAALVDTCVSNLVATRLAIPELLWCEPAIKQICLPLASGGAGLTSLVAHSGAAFLSTFMQLAIDVPSVTRAVAVQPSLSDTDLIASSPMLASAASAYNAFWDRCGSSIRSPISWLPGPRLFADAVRLAVDSPPLQCYSDVAKALAVQGFRDLYDQPVPFLYAFTTADSVHVRNLHRARLSVVAEIGPGADWLAVLPRSKELMLSDLNFCTSLRLRLGLSHSAVPNYHCTFCHRVLDHVADPYHELACDSQACSSAFRARHDLLKRCAADLGELTCHTARVELPYSSLQTRLASDYRTDVMFDGATDSFFIDVSFITSCTPSRVRDGKHVQRPNNVRHYIAHREDAKLVKYKPLATFLNRPCVPVVFDTLGCPGLAVKQFLEHLRRNLVTTLRLTQSRARALMRAFLPRLVIAAQRAVFQAAFRQCTQFSIDFGTIPACLPALASVPVVGVFF